jgi:hypothetical protein
MVKGSFSFSAEAVGGVGGRVLPFERDAGVLGMLMCRRGGFQARFAVYLRQGFDWETNVDELDSGEGWRRRALRGWSPHSR